MLLKVKVDLMYEYKHKLMRMLLQDKIIKSVGNIIY